MENCKVDVLLAIYNPDLNFLKKQLESIDNQNYTNVEVLVFDDCIENRTDKNYIINCLKKKKVRFLPYKEKNIGYVKAFEYLVQQSQADICAFCDQDDIWMPDKISVTLHELKSRNELLVSSDKQLIDENDDIFCESYDEIRGMKNKLDNSIIGLQNFFGTFADGLCLVADTQFAKKCIPFSEYTGHDKWLIACACAENRFYHIPKCLVQHRRHSNNVSGFCKDIVSKKNYRDNRIYSNNSVISELKYKYPDCTFLIEAEKFSKARINKNIIQLWKHRWISPKIAYFECITCWMPEFLFKIVINLLKYFKNIDRREQK